MIVGGDFLESCEWFEHFPESDVPIGAALQTLQLLDPLRAVDPGVPLWVHYTDAHPSKELHALAADLVAERLLQDARFGLTVNVGSR